MTVASPRAARQDGRPPRYRGTAPGAVLGLIRDPLGLLARAGRDLGDIYELALPGISLVVLNHPRHVRQVFIERASSYRRYGPFWDALRTYLGNGLLVNEGSSWKPRRVAVQSLLRHAELAKICDLMVQGAEDGLATWVLPGAARAFDVERGMAAVSMSVSARTIFGAHLDAEDGAALAPAMARVVDSMASQMLADRLPRWLPRPPRRRYRRDLALIDDRVCRLALLPPAQGEDGLLSALAARMTAQASDERELGTQIRDEAVNLFGGAYETTRTTLAWAMHFLARYPAVREQVTAEVDGVLGGRSPEFGDLARLRYTRSVIQETLRKYPPAAWILRTAVDDDFIDGYFIPAGTNVVLSVYGLHNNPEIWPDPGSFRPSRFDTDGAAQQVPLSWLPFGAGPRACVGQQFALMEAELVLALICQRFCIGSLASGRTRPQLRTTLKPKNGVLVHMRPRMGSERTRL